MKGRFIGAGALVAFSAAILVGSAIGPHGWADDPAGPPAICDNGGSHTPFPSGDPGSSGGQGNGFGKDCTPSPSPSPTPSPTEGPCGFKACGAGWGFTTTCAVPGSAQGGSIVITWGGSMPTFIAVDGTRVLVTQNPFTFGPLSAGQHVVLLDGFNAGFTISACPVPPSTVEGKGSGPSVPDTGAGA